MLRYSAVIRTIFCILCLFSFIWGCDQQPEAPPGPEVVTKKIVAPKALMPPKTPPKTEIAKAEIRPEASPPKTALTVKPIAKPEPQTTTKQASKPEVEAAPQEATAPKTETSTAMATAKPEAPDKKPDKKTDEKLMASLAPTDQKLQLAAAAYVYNPTGKLDPFAPLFKEEAPEAPIAPTKKKSKKKRTPLTPLERVDLSQLKLVGVIRAMSGDKALVQEASGKGYIVKKGTYIGTRSGKIVEILTDRIIVAEEVEDIFGKVSVQNRPLIIQKPHGE